MGVKTLGSSCDFAADFDFFAAVLDFFIYKMVTFILDPYCLPRILICWCNGF